MILRISTVFVDVSPCNKKMIFYQLLLGSFFKYLWATEGCVSTPLPLPLTLTTPTQPTFIAIASDKESNENVSFFGERLVLELPGRPTPADIHGKYINNARFSYFSEYFDMPLLQECGELNFWLVEGKVLSKKMIQKFIKKLKTSMKSVDKFKATLGHFHCIHAIKSVGFDELGGDLVKTLSIEHPEIMKKHLEIFGYLEDFSFLTVELVEELFGDKNDLLRPFGLDVLIETASFPVIKKCLEMWNYDLRKSDLEVLMRIWGESNEFKEILMEEPRGWLLWRKLDLFKGPFPIDKLIKILSIDNIEIYLNLILAFIYESELLVWDSMNFLEFLNADLHKNDVIEERYMTPEMVSELDSRKWDLWYENGKISIEIIKEQMDSKRKLIEKIKEMIEIKDQRNIIDKQMIIYNLFTLLQVPLNDFGRKSYLKSRDIENVKTALNDFKFINSVGFSEIVDLNNLGNENYWTVLWKQLEILEVDLVYDEARTRDFQDTKEILQLLLSMAFKEENFNFYWHSQLALFMISPMNFDESQIYLKTLIGFTRKQICELTSMQISVLKTFLHPEAVKNFIGQLENQNHLLELFRLAPEIMTRDQISELLKASEAKELMIYSIENANKLRFLDSFTTKDLADHFIIGFDYHLDNCEALYTVDPDALVGYLKASQGAINYPDLLIWWTHPRCWNNTKFVDLIAESIPFNVFFKHPKDSDEMNFGNILTDISGRIQRNPTENTQVLILKWLIHMDWFFFQFYNELYLDSSDNGSISSQYDRIMNLETKARIKLITWLKENESLEDGDILLDLVETSPLSYLRTSAAYDLLLSESVNKLEKGPAPQNLKGLHHQFAVFKSVPKIYQLKESDLEATVKNQIEKCEKLIEKYFEIIEKEIWLNRLKISNIPAFDKYTIKPVPTRFAKRLFHQSGAPIHDLQETFSMLSRTGHSLDICTTMEGKEFLEQLPNGRGIIEVRKRNHEAFIMQTRKILLENDLKNMKKNKSRIEML